MRGVMALAHAGIQRHRVHIEKVQEDIDPEIHPMRDLLEDPDDGVEDPWEGLLENIEDGPAWHGGVAGVISGAELVG